MVSFSQLQALVQREFPEEGNFLLPKWEQILAVISNLPCLLSQLHKAIL